MKCKLIGCQKNMAVAGPPNARDRGMCWKHAVVLGNALVSVSPIEIMKVTGIVPSEEVEKEKIRKHLGNVTLSRLGRF